jgi:hypothetical protein
MGIGFGLQTILAQIKVGRSLDDERADLPVSDRVG